MNWNQLYTTATPEEREEILLLMLQTLEARQQRLVLARGRLVRERRRAQRLHYLHDRRTPRPRRITRNLLRSLTLFIALTVSITTWLIAAHIPPMYGAPLLLGYDLLLLTILLRTPTRKQWILNDH